MCIVIGQDGGLQIAPSNRLVEGLQGVAELRPYFNPLTPRGYAETSRSRGSVCLNLIPAKRALRLFLARRESYYI